jgi:hypothetical protein
MHVRGYKVDEISGFTESFTEDTKGREAFNVWVRERFMVKDRILKGFYDHGKMEEDGIESQRLVVEIKPKTDDWMNLLVAWLSLFVSMPFYGALVMLIWSFIW